MKRDRLERARERWRYRGADRPPFAVVPGPGQESVWDFPRPPRVEQEARAVEVQIGGRVLAQSSRAWRVCETASPPTIYIPPSDIDMKLLHAASTTSYCEWKGAATHWSAVVGDRTLPEVAWSYHDPFPEYGTLRDLMAFHPGRVDRCLLGGVQVEPQPGHYYGGWVTPECVGPFKGDPGTGDW